MLTAALCFTTYWIMAISVGCILGKALHRAAEEQTRPLD